MKISKYAVCIKLSNGKCVMYNTLVFKRLFFSNDEASRIWNMKEHDLEVLSLLKEFNIYVEDDKEDKKIKKEFFKKLKSNLADITDITITIGSYCNLKCTYCENLNCNTFSQNEISKEKQHEVLNEISEYFKVNGIDNSSICLKGREPLFNIQSFIRFCDEVNKVANSVSIVTNGTLINKRTANYFMEKGMSLYICLDGPKKINDARRKYKKGCDSVYNRIMTSIGLLNEIGMKYNLLVNLAGVPFNCISGYSKWLKELKPQSVNLFFYGIQSLETNFIPNEVVREHIRIFKDVRRNGIREQVMTNYLKCVKNEMYNWDSFNSLYKPQIVIDTAYNIFIVINGRVFQKYAYDDERADLNSIVLNESEKYLSQIDSLVNKKCLECSAFPICGGGYFKKDCSVLFETIPTESYCEYIKHINEAILNTFSNLNK